MLCMRYLLKYYSLLNDSFATPSEAKLAVSEHQLVRQGFRVVLSRAHAQLELLASLGSRCDNQLLFRLRYRDRV